MNCVVLDPVLILSGEGNPKARFKYNPTQGVVDQIKKLVHASWQKLDPGLDDSTCLKFVISLKKVKEQFIPQAREQLISKDRELKQIEKDMNSYMFLIPMVNLQMRSHIPLKGQNLNE